jgi:hypothetical protein
MGTANFYQAHVDPPNRQERRENQEEIKFGEAQIADFARGVRDERGGQQWFDPRAIASLPLIKSTYCNL